MYTGTLINDLLDLVDRACHSWESLRTESARCAGRATAPALSDWEPRNSEPEKFPQSLGLRPADRDFGLLLIVHPQLVRALEPGDNFADAVDIHQVGTVSSPK